MFFFVFFAIATFLLTRIRLPQPRPQHSFPANIRNDIRKRIPDNLHDVDYADIPLPDVLESADALRIRMFRIPNTLPDTDSGGTHSAGIRIVRKPRNRHNENNKCLDTTMTYFKLSTNHEEKTRLTAAGLNSASLR